MLTGGGSTIGPPRSGSPDRVLRKGKQPVPAHAVSTSPALIDYATRAQDLQFRALAKGSDYLLLATEKVAKALDLVPRPPEAAAKTARPLFAAVGTPAELIAFGRTSTMRLAEAVTGFQGRMAEVVEASALERFASRSKD